jgi:hypothetical protein
MAFPSCWSSPSVLPVKHITQIRLSVAQMPDEKVRLPAPRVAKITEDGDMIDMMEYLHTIDWTQPGEDMAAIRLPAPDGSIFITSKHIETHQYDFYWDGKFVLVKDNRLIRGGRTETLKALVKRVCKP